MTFNEFLNSDIENSDEIIDYYLNFLTEFSSKDFPYEQGIQLRGSAEKFSNTIDRIIFLDKEKTAKYMENIERFSESLNYYRRRKDYSPLLKFFLPLYKTSFTRVQNDFEKIYSATINLVNDYNRTSNFRSQNINMNGFYDTTVTNKEKVKELISEAIDLINSESSITQESKKQLTEYLNKVIKDLERKGVDWTKVIGRIKEIVIILGALSTVIGNTSSLFKAKEKLEQTSEVIEKTSINLNHNTLNQTFIFQEIKQLNNLNSILIEEGKKN